MQSPHTEGLASMVEELWGDDEVDFTPLYYAPQSRRLTAAEQSESVARLSAPRSPRSTSPQTARPRHPSPRALRQQSSSPSFPASRGSSPIRGGGGGGGGGGRSGNGGGVGASSSSPRAGRRASLESPAVRSPAVSGGPCHDAGSGRDSGSRKPRPPSSPRPSRPSSPGTGRRLSPTVASRDATAGPAPTAAKKTKKKVRKDTGADAREERMECRSKPRKGKNHSSKGATRSSRDKNRERTTAPRAFGDGDGPRRPAHRRVSSCNDIDTAAVAAAAMASTADGIDGAITSVLAVAGEVHIPRRRHGDGGDGVTGARTEPIKSALRSGGVADGRRPPRRSVRFAEEVQVEFFVATAALDKRRDDKRAASLIAATPPRDRTSSARRDRHASPPPSLFESESSPTPSMCWASPSSSPHTSPPPQPRRSPSAAPLTLGADPRGRTLPPLPRAMIGGGDSHHTNNNANDMPGRDSSRFRELMMSSFRSRWESRGLAFGEAGTPTGGIGGGGGHGRTHRRASPSFDDFGAGHEADTYIAALEASGLA